VASPDLADRRVPGAPHTVSEIVAHMAFWQTVPRLLTEAADAGVGGTGWVAPKPLGRGPASSRASSAWSHPARADQAVARIRRSVPALVWHITATHVGAHNAHHLARSCCCGSSSGAWPPPAGS
jgi:hypothetical protein